MSYAPKFWNKKADNYARTPVGDEQSYAHKLKTTQSYLRPEMDVLEFGCGTGSTALAHAPYVKSILGLDYSSRMIGIATGKATDQGVSNVRFEVGSIENYDGSNASYDVVMGMSILHLLEDKQAVLGKIFSLLKPGGLFVSSTVCVDELGPIKWVLPFAALVGLAPSVDRFSAKELEDCITEAGFEIAHQWQPGRGKAVFIVARKP